MTEFLHRPYTPGDEAAVVTMLNEYEAATDGEPFWTAAQLRTIMTGIVADPRLDTRLTFAATGELAAFGLVAAPNPGLVRCEAYGGVHPEWWGRGLGRALLSWQFDRLSEMRADRPADQVLPARWEVETAATVSNDRARKLYAEFGLEPVRYFFDMSAPTPSPRAPAYPAGLRAVPFTPELTEATYAAHIEAFADHWGFELRPLDQWQQVTVGSEQFRPDLSRLVFDGDEVAAYLLGYDGLDDRLHIGQLGTRRPWRRRGLATAMLVDAMQAAAVSGKQVAQLGVDADSPTGAVGVYERAGFSVTSRFASFQGPLERRG